jgi:hypothetical protein
MDSKNPGKVDDGVVAKVAIVREFGPEHHHQLEEILDSAPIRF